MLAKPESLSNQQTAERGRVPGTGDPDGNHLWAPEKVHTAGERPVQAPKMGAVLAQFMERRGRRIIKGCGALWHSVEGGIFMCCPHYLRLVPSREEVTEMLRAGKGTGVRFASDVWPGVPSGVYLYRGKKYDFANLHTTFRRKVRRGMEQLHVREVEPRELLAQGLEMNRATMARQGRYDSEFGDAKRWSAFVEALRRTPGILAVGAYHGDRLSAYMILCRENRVLQILHQMSRIESLRYNPNHVLTFEVTRQAAEDPDLDCISYGLESLVYAPGVHRYKLQFGYEFCEHHSVIVLHPWLSGLHSRPVRAALRMIRERIPGDQRLERVETVLRTAALSQSRFGREEMASPQSSAADRPVTEGSAGLPKKSKSGVSGR